MKYTKCNNCHNSFRIKDMIKDYKDNKVFCPICGAQIGKINQDWLTETTCWLIYNKINLNKITLFSNISSKNV